MYGMLSIFKQHTFFKVENLSIDSLINTVKYISISEWKCVFVDIDNDKKMGNNTIFKYENCQNILTPLKSSEN